MQVIVKWVKWVKSETIQKLENLIIHMADSLNFELLKCRELIKWSFESQKIQSQSMSSPISENSFSISDRSFIKRWRANDKLFEGRFSSSGNSTPRSPTSPVHQPNNTPANMKKLQQESSDTEDFLFTHKIEYSRYSNDFEELEEIGGGSFGRVYKCKHILDKLPYAVKKIPIKNTATTGQQFATIQQL